MGDKLRIRYATFAMLLLPLAASALTYMRIDSKVVETRLRAEPATQAERLKVLRSQFKNGGCQDADITEQAVAGEEFPNLICTLPGTEAGTIVVGARADYRSKGDEAAVDWATLEMLPLMAESLNGARHRYTLVFVAFTGHRSFAGSSEYVNGLSEAKRRSVVAMVDLEQVGKTPVSFSPPVVENQVVGHTMRRPMRGFSVGANDKPDVDVHQPLIEFLRLAALTLKMQDEPGMLLEAPPTEAKTFYHANIPSMTLTSAGYTTVPRPGGIEAKLVRTSVDKKVYFDTYNLLCVYVLYLDRDVAVSSHK